jgi:hypothetical protein
MVLVFYKGKENKEAIVNHIFKTFFTRFKYEKVNLKSMYFSLLKKQKLINKPELLYARFSYTGDFVEFVGLVKYVDMIVKFVKLDDEEKEEEEEEEDKLSEQSIEEIEGSESSEIEEIEQYTAAEMPEEKAGFLCELTNLTGVQIKLILKINIIWMLKEMFDDLSADLSENTSTGLSTLVFRSPREESVDEARQVLTNTLEAMVQNEYELAEHVDFGSKEEFYMKEIERLNLSVVIEKCGHSPKKVVIHSTGIEDFEACKAIFEIKQPSNEI